MYYLSRKTYSSTVFTCSTACLIVLVQAYENHKKRAKKAAAEDKVQRVKTGGGTFQTHVTELDEKLLALLGNRATPLDNAFDSDSTYHTGVQCAKLFMSELS